MLIWYSNNAHMYFPVYFANCNLDQNILFFIHKDKFEQQKSLLKVPREKKVREVSWQESKKKLRYQLDFHILNLEGKR